MKTVRITFWLQFVLAILIAAFVFTAANDWFAITLCLLMMLCTLLNVALVLYRVFRKPSFEVFSYILTDLILIILYYEYVGGTLMLAKYHEEFLK